MNANGQRPRGRARNACMHTDSRTQELGAPGVSAMRRRTRALPQCPGHRRPQARLTMDPGGETG
eukprot:3575289-Alexandrium_andersonii.AAC.1